MSWRTRSLDWRTRSLTSDGDGDLLATVLGHDTIAGPAATSGMTPFRCIIVDMFNMPNNSAWLNVLGIEWNSIDPESAKTSGAGTSSSLRSWSKLAGPSGCDGWSFTISAATAGTQRDGSASPAGTGRDGTAHPPLPGRDGTAHPPLPGTVSTTGPGRAWSSIIAHASRVDRKTTIKNAVPGCATRDGHMTWSQDSHMTTFPDCSKIKNKNIIKNKKEICCHVGCLFNFTCIFNLWCKNE